MPSADLVVAGLLRRWPVPHSLGTTAEPPMVSWDGTAMCRCRTAWPLAAFAHPRPKCRWVAYDMFLAALQQDRCLNISNLEPSVHSTEYAFNITVCATASGALMACLLVLCVCSACLCRGECCLACNRLDCCHSAQAGRQTVIAAMPICCRAQVGGSGHVPHSAF